MKNTWKRGIKEIETDYGRVFSMTCSGYNRTEVAKELGFNNISTLNNKLRSFRDVDEVKHIKFIRAELKKRLTEINK